MTPSQDDERFDDPAHDEVRALLADVRVTEPMPVAVAARLDDVLAGLRPAPSLEEPSSSSEGQPSNVVPLRRGWAPRLAAAAAVVVVAGGAAVGVGQVIERNSGADDVAALEDSGASTTTDSETSAPESADAEVPGNEASLDTVLGARSLPSLTAADFDETALVLSRQFRELRSEAGALEQDPPAYAAAPTPTESDLTASPSPQTESLRNLLTIDDLRGRTAQNLAQLCAGPVGNEAGKVRIRFDGELAVLLFGTVADGRQPVSAWTCDGSRLLARTVVPVS